MATAKKVALGKKIPAFKAAATSGQELKIGDFKGKKVVLWFYPKDNTSGCTKEGEGFRDHYKKFKRAGVEVIGVSRDSLKSHENFKDKYDFPFELISDPDEELCKLFDVMKMKSMYGKKFLGVERSTFVIDESGKLAHEWRKVKVPGHVEEVLDFVKSM